MPEQIANAKPVTLRERNLKTIGKIVNHSAEMTAMRESMKRHHGVDILDTEKSFPVLKENFSWKALKAKLSLREADAASSFSQFLRAGVNTIVNAEYQSVETTFEDWVRVVPSKAKSEPYAPNHGVAFPQEIGPSEDYAEVGAAALDLQLANRKFGSIYALETELLEDDQTGSFQEQAAMLGEYLRLVHEVLCYGKLASVASMQYVNMTIPTSETKPSYESAYPWSVAFRGGGANRPASYGILTQASVQAAKIGLMNQKNLQGIKMQVNPNRLIVGPALQFDAAVLLNSGYYPSGAAAAGGVGGAFAINPIKGIADLTVSRFVFKNDGTVNGDSKAWFMKDDKKPGFVLQMRTAVELVQEAPNSGKSFEKDQMRWKGKTRCNADFTDPRFSWQGNDGSVLS